jgi:predicted unusual protein kinase regulating ubiquinone biosynthesis (AarF/ABC1/UbiB family)
MSYATILTILTYLIFVLQRAANALSARDQGAQASHQHSRIAQDMKNKFVSLGPTYIKLGQLMSTRPDLIGKEYIAAFRELQDRVPPFSGRDAVSIVEQELNVGSIAEVFSQFNSTPLASASIGQVHLAELNGSSTQVAVKVQRPGIRHLFDMDLDVLRVLVSFLDSFYSNIDGVRCDWKQLFEEYVAIMYEELDYRREGLQGIRFKTNFENTPWITVPKVIY